MIKFSVIWLVHWIVTVGGWYLVDALAQGVADGTGVAPLPLVLLHYFIQLLAFPLVIAAVSIWPMQIGGFGLASFFVLLGLAAVNSAMVTAAGVWLVRTIRTRKPHGT